MPRYGAPSGRARGTPRRPLVMELPIRRAQPRAVARAGARGPHRDPRRRRRASCVERPCWFRRGPRGSPLRRRHQGARVRARARRPTRARAHAQRRSAFHRGALGDRRGARGGVAARIGGRGVMQIAVVGGGITGLAAALRLLQRAPRAEVTLFEKAERLGGEIHTQRVDGFVIEAGADSFLTRKARGVALCKELGLADRLVARQAQHAGTFVRHDGALHPLPEGFTGMIPTRIDSLTQSALLSPKGRRALADECSMPAPSHRREESIAEFVMRRFGREVYDHIVEPLMAGIYGGNGERLSLDATFPGLRDLERRYGSVIRGLAASREQGLGNAAPPFVSFAGGMGELIDHLETRLREASIQRSAEVVALTPRAAGGFVLVLGGGASAEADAVILATPAPATARITRAFDRELS